MNKLKVYNLATKVYYTYKKGLFKVEIKEGYIYEYDRLILAVSPEDAITKYEQKYNIDELELSGRITFEHPEAKIVKKEIKFFPTDNLTFNNLKRYLNYDDFFMYAKQQLFSNNLVEEIIE